MRHEETLSNLLHLAVDVKSVTVEKTRVCKSISFWYRSTSTSTTSTHHLHLLEGSGFKRHVMFSVVKAFTEES